MKKDKDIVAQEALEILSEFNAVTPAISMGVGKTYIGLRDIANNYTPGSKVLVAAHKRSVFNTWKEEARMRGLEYLLDDIVFSTYRSLHKASPNYSAVYLDECHNLKSSHGEWLRDFKGKKVVGLTGTPPAYQYSEAAIVMDTYCPVRYEYLLDDAVDDNLLNDYRIIVHLVPLSSLMNIRKEIKKTGKSFMTSELKEYQYWCRVCSESPGGKRGEIARIMRMRALMNFQSKEHYAMKLANSITEKQLIFTSTKAQADRLAKHTYHSGNKESERNLELFKAGIISRMACVEQLSEGTNIRGLKEGIVMHSYGNEKRLPQKIGRFLRLNPSDICTVHTLAYKDTVDAEWVSNALKNFNPTKVIWKDMQ